MKGALLLMGILFGPLVVALALTGHPVWSALVWAFAVYLACYLRARREGGAA